MIKTLRYHGQEDLRLERVPQPELMAGFVRVRPSFVGICGSDLTEYAHGPLATWQLRQATEQGTPVALGHEFSAVVEETQGLQSGVDVGDHVAVFPLTYDGTCSSCQMGSENLCANFGSLGFSEDGGLTETLQVKAEHLFKLPPNVSLQQGALVEPLSVAWHALEIGRFKAGDNILVVGAGPVGLGLCLIARSRGAGRIVVSEISSQRRSQAARFGATHLIDPVSGSAVDDCNDLLKGESLPLAFECSGVGAGLDLAIRATSIKGTIVNVSIFHEPPRVDVNALTTGEKRYIGSLTYTKEDFSNVLKAISSGSLDPQSMITSVVFLENAVEQAFKAGLKDKDSVIKVLIDVQGE